MVFRVPKIQACCFCASLQLGSYFIGGLNLLFFSAVLILSIVSSRRAASIIQVMVYDSVFLNVGAFSCVFLYGLYKKDHTLMFSWILQLTIFALFVLNNLLSSMLFVGLTDSRPEEMTVEMTAELIGVVLVGYSLVVTYNHYRNLVEAPTEESIGSPSTRS